MKVTRVRRMMTMTMKMRMATKKTKMEVLTRKSGLITAWQWTLLVAPGVYIQICLHWARTSIPVTDAYRETFS
jgi:hypothetical protein